VGQYVNVSGGVKKKMAPDLTVQRPKPNPTISGRIDCFYKNLFQIARPVKNGRNGKSIVSEYSTRYPNVNPLGDHWHPVSASAYSNMATYILGKL
jgi:hypothetical protein